MVKSPERIVTVAQVTYSIHTVRVELYESTGDYVRLVLEILLTIWVCIHLLSEFWAMIQARRHQVHCTNLAAICAQCAQRLPVTGRPELVPAILYVDTLSVQALLHCLLVAGAYILLILMTV